MRIGIIWGIVIGFGEQKVKMAKKEIILCDVCEKKVAVTKCLMCKKDLCDTCRKQVNVDIQTKGTSDVEITLDYCEEHRDSITDALSRDSNKDAVWNEIKEKLNDYFKRKISFEEL